MNSCKSGFVEDLKTSFILNIFMSFVQSWFYCKSIYFIVKEWSTHLILFMLSSSLELNVTQSPVYNSNYKIKKSYLELFKMKLRLEMTSANS